MDLYPTLLDLAGAKPAAGTRSTARASRRCCSAAAAGAGSGPQPAVLALPRLPRRRARTSGGRPRPASIRAGDWKLIEFFETGKLELYNLKDDIGEKTDLAAKMPDKAKELHAKLVAWRKAVNAPMPAKR